MSNVITGMVPALRNGRILVPLTAGICLVFLAVVLKNILLVPAAQLSSDLILYIILYMGFIVSFPFTGSTDTGPADRTLLWAGIIVIVTLAIIAVYAL